MSCCELFDGNTTLFNFPSSYEDDCICNIIQTLEKVLLVAFMMQYSAECQCQGAVPHLCVRRKIVSKVKGIICIAMLLNVHWCDTSAGNHLIYERNVFYHSQTKMVLNDPRRIIR